MGKRNVVAICGAEPYYDPKNPTKIKHFSVTFLNNMRTWKLEHPLDKMVIIDARNYLKSQTPITDMWADVCKAYPEGIDLLIYSGHSSTEHLLVFSHCLLDIPHEERFIGWEFDFKAPYSKEAEIILQGCQTGGQQKVKFTESIAQVMANKTGKIVWGYVSKSYQKEKPKGIFHQVSDDKIGLVKFTPRG